MHDADHSGSTALDELRRRLEEGRARARLDQTQLARKADLSRATVSKALTAAGRVPSVETVTALATELKLPVGELLQLRRTAVQESGEGTASGSVPGRPIGQWEPHELEVHPAGSGTVIPGADVGRTGALPTYVERSHDDVLADAVRDAKVGRSRIVVLVGTSSTGKTRACWEAVQPLAAKGWRLWHPFDPTRAEAALKELDQVGPQTVVWLNEAQHYLGDRTCGERIAAAVHQLLMDKARGPVLVLGTLWPEYAHQYTALPAPDGPDPHSRVRELLAGRTLPVPDAFDAAALATTTALAEQGDKLLADALTRAREGGRITQDLAGAPELLRRYAQATLPAGALLKAAMDARRLGVGLHLPQTFLTDAAIGYLSQDDYDQLDDDWAEQAYAELAKPVHGKQVPLRRTTPRPPRHPPTPTPSADLSDRPAAGSVFRLADYLEQHGRTARKHLCPPAAFWHAAHSRLTHPDDLNNLGAAARARHRLQWAHHLYLKSAHHGGTEALLQLAMMRRNPADRDGVVDLARQTAGVGATSGLCQLAMLWVELRDEERAETLLCEAVRLGDTGAPFRVAMLRENAGDQEGAEAFYREAARLGDTTALARLAEIREEAGDGETAVVFARQAASIGDATVLARLAKIREEAGDRESADALYREAARLGDTGAWTQAAVLSERGGDREAAEALARQAVGVGATGALFWLAMMREEAGDRDSAQALAREAACAGDATALARLTEIRERAGDRESAEALARQAGDVGKTRALLRLAVMREEMGDRDSAQALALEVARLGDARALVRLAVLRERAGDRESAEALARQGGDLGKTRALVGLAGLRERAGDWESAEAFYREVARLGDTRVLARLAVLRERVGDRDGAEALARQVGDRGDTSALFRLAVLREEVGDQVGAEAFFREVARHGDVRALFRLAVLRGRAGDREGAEGLARQAGDLGDTKALSWLAKQREQAGDWDGAVALAQQVGGLGDTDALYRLAVTREAAGEREDAEALYRYAADLGGADRAPHELSGRNAHTRLWPYGLEPDGAPTRPWQAVV